MAKKISAKCFIPLSTEDRAKVYDGVKEKYDAWVGNDKEAFFPDKGHALLFEDGFDLSFQGGSEDSLRTAIGIAQYILDTLGQGEVSFSWQSSETECPSSVNLSYNLSYGGGAATIRSGEPPLIMDIGDIVLDDIRNRQLLAAIESGSVSSIEEMDKHIRELLTDADREAGISVHLAKKADKLIISAVRQLPDFVAQSPVYVTDLVPFLHTPSEELKKSVYTHIVKSVEILRSKF